MPPISSITPKKPIEIIEKPSHIDPADGIKVDEISIADIEDILNGSVKLLKDNDLGVSYFFQLSTNNKYFSYFVNVRDTFVKVSLKICYICFNSNAYFYRTLTMIQRNANIILTKKLLYKKFDKNYSNKIYR